jgi:cyclic beta-1,2-glucan synthetase
MAADIYSVPPHAGTGGWTWYTGSGGWMYRLGLERILGIRREGATLHIDPRIPGHWPGYRVAYRYGQAVYHIAVENPEAASLGVARVTLDGREMDGPGVTLVDDGREHSVVVRLASRLT